MNHNVLFFAQAVITKYHRLGILTSGNLFPHHSESWEVQDEGAEQLATW